MSEIVSALELLQSRLRTMAIHLDAFKHEIDQEVEATIKQNKRPKKTPKRTIEAFDSMQRYKAEMRDEIRGAIVLGSEYEIELAACRKVSVALESGEDAIPFVLDADVELEKLIEKVLTPDQKLILETLRRVAKDLAEIGYSKATKIDVLSLLSSGAGTGGGMLNRWWNREVDPRRKALLLELTQMVVQVYAEKPGADDNAAKLIPGICDRLEETGNDSNGNKSKHEIDANLERAIEIWNSNPIMTKKELEHEILKGSYSDSSHRSFFNTVKNYSDKQHGVGYLRPGSSGTKPQKRE